MQAISPTNALFQDISILTTALKPFEERKVKGNADITNRNEGEISFCNIAIWLIFYQMLNQDEKEKCLEKIQTRSNMQTEELTKLKNTIKRIFTTENIKKMIENYGKENVSIDLSDGAINAGCINNIDDNLLKWLKDNDILKSDTRDIKKAQNTIDTGDKYLKIQMKKDIDYQWTEDGSVLKTTYGKFCQKDRGTYDDFLSCAATKVKASVLRYQDRDWLILQKSTFKKQDTNKSPQNGKIFFAQPLLTDDEITNLGTDNQEAYSNILHNTDTHKFYNHLKQSDLNKDLMNHGEILSKNTVLQTIDVRKQEESNKFKDFVFPNLKNKFAGTGIELNLSGKSPTIFAPLFANGLSINRAQFANAVLECKFAIKYDEKCGQIKNEVGMVFADSVCNYKGYNIIINKPCIVFF